MSIKCLFVGFKHLVCISDNEMALSMLDTFIGYDQDGFKHLVSSGNENHKLYSYGFPYVSPAMLEITVSGFLAVNFVLEGYGFFQPFRTLGEVAAKGIIRIT